MSILDVSNFKGNNKNIVPNKTYTIFNVNLIQWARVFNDAIEIKLQGCDNVLVIKPCDDLYDSHLKTMANLRHQVIMGAK